MKTVAIITGVTAFASTVAGHATWQQLWINGEDQGKTCVREPQSNSPIQDVSSNDLRCNAGPKAAASTCAVAAGDTVTIEMHQHDSRGCTEEAIGGAHYGPVLAYMSKVEDAATADGSDPWFKIFQNTWAKNPSGSSGSDDFWGTKDLNTNCGTMDLKIPADLAPGDYLLRAEAIALHAAGGSGGSQHYMSCYQITVSGSGTSTPEGVSFPGAYSATDPGILINIYQSLSEYVAPGPAVIAGGSEAVAGNAGSAAPTKVATQTATSAPTASTAAPVTTTTSAAAVSSTQAAPTATTAPITTTTAAAPSTLVTSTKPATTSAAATGVALWGQCGGKGFTGSTTCAKGTCKFQNDYYSQCLE